jgi:uncharacterized protein YuzE
MGYTVRSEKGSQNYVNVTIGDKYEISNEVEYLGDNVLIHKNKDGKIIGVEVLDFSGIEVQLGV